MKYRDHDFAIPRSFENIYIQNARVLLRWQSEDSLARAVKNIFPKDFVPLELLPQTDR